MMNTFLSRSRLIPGALSAVLALTLVACSSSDSGSSDATVSPTSQAVAAFPVVVEHAYGKAEISAQPQRVIALGWLEADMSVALGVEPIVIAAFPFTPSQISPWLEPHLSGKQQLMTVVGATTELDMEAIAALAPDLIIAPTYVKIAEVYDRLSQIAPTLGPQDKDYLRVTWQNNTRAIAKAVGKQAEAEKLITETEEYLRSSTAGHSEFKGLTYTLGIGVANNVRIVQDKSDAGLLLLEAFGMTYSETAAALAPLNDGSGGAAVSEENLRAIDADLIFLAYLQDAPRAYWEASPLFNSLTAVQSGGYISLTAAEIAGMRNPSPLSLRFAVDEIILGRALTAVKNR